MKSSDIEGLTAAEIAEKYALPAVPDMITYVVLPEDMIIEISITGGQATWNNAAGGNVQYGIKVPEPEKSWFVNPRQLK